MEKDIWIIVIILCILGILAVIYKVWKDAKMGLLENFFGKSDEVETFLNPVLKNNIIQNGTFSEGKAPVQYTGSYGDAEIVVFKNNGPSSYVLKLGASKTLQPTDPIFYRLDFSLKPNQVYYVSCLYYSPRKNPLNFVVVFNKSNRIMLKSEEETTFKYIKDGDFKYRYALFKTPLESENIRTTIYFNYSTNKMVGFNYLTDLGLFELNYVDTFIPIFDDLRSYFNPFNGESAIPGSATLTDLSFNGFDFKASLAKNVMKGNINLAENALTGPSAFKLQNKGKINLGNNFTFFINVRGSNISSKVIETFTSAEEQELVPAQMSLGQYQAIWNKVGCKSILTNDSISIWRTQPFKTVYADMKNYAKKASECSGTDIENEICIPGKCPKKGNISGTSSPSSQSMADVLLKQPASIKNISDNLELNKYLLNSDANNLISFPGNQGTALALIVPRKYGPLRLFVGGTMYETVINTPSFMEMNLAVVYDGDNIMLYLNEELIMQTDCPKIYFDNNSVMINPNGTFLGNLYAFAYYNKAFTDQQVVTVSKYFVKMIAIGYEQSTLTDEQKKWVESFIIKDNPTSEEEIQIKKLVTGNKKLETLAPILARMNPEQRKIRIAQIQEEEEIAVKIRENENKCPKVVFEDNHYYVIVQPNTKLSEELGYNGLRDYGTNIDTAKQIFETNFPKCPIPDVLDRRKYKGELTECPFIVLNDDNPCKKFECRGTDWKNGTSNNENCRKSVDTYCSKYAYMDNACYCWRSENQNDPNCKQWRGKFDNPDKCDFSKYPIDKHPEADKWIRKDKIPCWGCNLTAPETSGDYSCRQGSGGR